MIDRRAHGEVQLDPIRARLGRAGTPRDVVCPNCGAGYATERRWQMRCPRCDHRWIDRSYRTWIDDLRDSRGDLVVTVVLAGSVLVAAAALLTWIGWLFSEAVGMRGWERTYGLALLFAGSFLSLIVLGRLLRH
jgi:hypothetical protein